MAKSRTANAPRRSIRCYFCGHHFEVSELTMSVPCPRCNKALKVEDVHVKTYVPVNDLQTCGRITVSKTGRVVAKVIRAASGIDCDGTLEGAVEADDHMVLSVGAPCPAAHADNSRPRQSAGDQSRSRGHRGSQADFKRSGARETL
jgi:phage FluMu protein Com